MNKFFFIASLALSASNLNADFPDTYTNPLTTAQGNRVWGVYTEAGEPEKAHRHDGGYLFARDQPITVYSYPSHEELYSSLINGTFLRAIYLPPIGMHYAVTPEPYEAVFIEINKASSASGHECQRVTLQSAWIHIGSNDVFIISDTPMAVQRSDCIQEEMPLPDLPHFVYYLEPEQQYQLSSQTGFYLLELEVRNESN